MNAIVIGSGGRWTLKFGLVALVLFSWHQITRMSTTSYCFLASTTTDVLQTSSPEKIDQSSSASTEYPLLSSYVSDEDFVCPPVDHPELRPELVHIRKTGGSTLEILASIHNISWGACHWNRMINGMTRGQKCPPSPRHTPNNENVINPQWRIHRWHVPPKWMSPDDTFWLEDAAPFVVVRNPYDRIVSAWNYGHKPSVAKNATLMNKFILERGAFTLKHRPKHGGLPHPSYFWNELPQVDYITPGTRILRQETLERDFRCMMEEGHDIHWEKWPASNKKKNASRKDSLTAANLSPQAKAMIEKVYREDFLQLGYAME